MANDLVRKLKLFIKKANKEIDEIDDFYLKVIKQNYEIPKTKLGTLLMPKPHYRYNWKTQQAERVK